MARIRSRGWRRAGFTLIELVIVLGIILLLAALLLSGVMKVMGMAPEVQTRTEISEMEVALKAFMSEYSLSDPPPSVLVLREDLAYTSSPLDLQSITFLKKTFGKNLGSTIYNPATGQLVPLPPAATPWVDWNGDGIQQTGPLGTYLLEGEQCLVFYLGGIQATVSGTPACLGFNPANTNPAAPSGTGVRRMGPYYPFAAGRLLPLNGVPNLPNVSRTANGFFVYMDPWNAKYSLPAYGGAKPYAYFSSSGNNNAYNANAAALALLGLTGECSSLQTAAPVATVPLPWFTAANTFVNPKAYQILSAGRDGYWGNSDYSGGSAGAGPGHDDQANFSSRILGANQQ
jgi:prepilin-type N-terminal cleavage/methylation domain-containing protein